MRCPRYGVDYEREIVRRAWDAGFFALRGAGSGSGAYAYPKPDIIIFKPGGVVEIVQVKSTKKGRLRIGPDAWANEVLIARRLRELGFRAQAWLFIRMTGKGRAAEARIRLDGHEDDVLIVERGAGEGPVVFEWRARGVGKKGGQAGVALTRGR